MSNPKKQLLNLAKTYKSADEFKAKNLSKYLLAKRQLLLPIAFPKVKAQPRAIRGIYKLYMRNKVVFIGHSTTNALEAILATPTTTKWNHFKLYPLSSDSDIQVLSLYLANKYRPIYNTNLGKQQLSFTFPHHKILGKPLVGNNVQLQDS